MAMIKNFVWSHKEYTLKEFVASFKNHLPMIVRVTQGYCGYDKFEYTISNEEVYNISHINSQTRVVTKDSTNRRLSIPVDYPVKFHRIQHGQKYPAMPLRQLLQLMAQRHAGLRLVPENHAKLTFWVGADSRKKTNIETLEAVDVFEDQYLVGNNISGGQMHKLAVAMPLFLSIKMVIAEGLENGTPNEFQQVLATYRQQARMSNNETVEGNSEIMFYENDHHHIDDYLYTEPKTYISCGELGALRKQISGNQNIQKPPPPVAKKPHQIVSHIENIYEEIPAELVHKAHDIKHHKGKQVKPKTLPKSFKKIPASQSSHTGSMSQRPLTMGSEDQKFVTEKQMYSALDPMKASQHTYSALQLPPPTHGRQTSYFRSIDDVPKSLKDVPKTGVADCLKFVHLEKYIEKFISSDIDGDILISLEQDVMINDLGMSKLDAIKLYKFVHESWRPK